MQLIDMMWVLFSASLIFIMRAIQSSNRDIWNTIFFIFGLVQGFGWIEINGRSALLINAPFPFIYGDRPSIQLEGNQRSGNRGPEYV